MAKYIPSRNYIGSSEIATDLDVTGPVDIDGAVQINNTLTVGVDGTGYDVKFYGDTSGRDMLWKQAQDALILKDSVELRIGTGYDLRLYHDGSNSRIRNNNGDLYISQNADDKDIIFTCDDGSGGTTAYITLDGSAEKTVFTKDVRFNDSIDLNLGAGNDFILRHDGSNSWIINQQVGDLYIRQNVDDKDIIFQCDDGSGGTTAYITLDGSDTSVFFSKTLKVADSKYIGLGDSFDFHLQHNGTDSKITNSTGDLYIINGADDKDIIFQCDDGSGGLTTYLHVDGNSTLSKFLKPVNFGVDGSSVDVTFYGDTSGRNMFWDASQDKLRASDNVQLTVGSSVDFQISHDGTNTLLQNNTGNLDIKNNQNDGDITLSSDDGSGGMTPYMTIDGGSVKTKFDKDLLLKDSVALQLGTDTDAALYHSGGEGSLVNYTGNFRIIQSADNSDIQFFCDDGSGGTTEYLRFDGGFGSPQINIPDGVGMNFGDGLDLRINHDGSNSVIQSNGTGNLEIKQKNNDADIILSSDDGSGGVTAYLTLDGSAGHTTVQKEINFEDSVKLTFGAQPGGDLQVYHDGSNSYIDDAGTGALNIRSNSVVAGKYTGEVLFRGTADGAFEAFYDNSVKLSTTSTGIDVAGAIEIDKTLTMAHTADPSDPATGKSVMWSDTSGNLKVKINVAGSVVTRTLAAYED